MTVYPVILIFEIALAVIGIVLIIAICFQLHKIRKKKAKENITKIKHDNNTSNNDLLALPYEKTLNEKLLTLSTDQHRFFTSILNYAMGKEYAKKQETKYYVEVLVKKKTILKLSIRRNTTLASCRFENDQSKDQKHKAKLIASNIPQKDTQILVTDEGKMHAAFRMIDLMLEQDKIEKERKRAQKKEKRAHVQQAH